MRLARMRHRYICCFLVHLLACQASQAEIAAAVSDIDPVAYLRSQGFSPNYTVAAIWQAHAHLPNYNVVRAAALDTFEALPLAYDPVYQNPCWLDSEPQSSNSRNRRHRDLSSVFISRSDDNFDGFIKPQEVGSKHFTANASRDVLSAEIPEDRASGSGVFRCLPYFQILGVSKCGTTDLYQRLSRHPDMRDCGYKGPHFWDESTYPDLRKKDPAREGKYDGSFKAYIRIFDQAAAHIQNHPASITGEASSNTFTAVFSHLRGSTIRKKVDATLADYLAEATPWARFIVLFRDPVTRYYSAFHYYRNRQLGAGSPQEFHTKALQDINSWNNCIGRSGSRQCLKLYEPQQLVKGLYAEFMTPWLERFTADQLLFLRNEDYQTAPQEHLSTVMTFLGLRNLSSLEWAAVIGKARANSQSGKYARMLPESVTALQDFYRPYNQRLSAAMGGDPRWLWGY